MTPDMEIENLRSGRYRSAAHVTRIACLAVAAIFSGTAQASADPITAAIGGIAAWYASLVPVGQALVQIGVGLALSAASMGLQYLLSGGGKRVNAAQDQPGVLIPVRDGLLPVIRAYGTVAASGGVFFRGAT